MLEILYLTRVPVDWTNAFPESFIFSISSTPVSYSIINSVHRTYVSPVSKMLTKFTTENSVKLYNKRNWTHRYHSGKTINHILIPFSSPTIYLFTYSFFSLFLARFLRECRAREGERERERKILNTQQCYVCDDQFRYWNVYMRVRRCYL